MYVLRAFGGPSAPALGALPPQLEHESQSTVCPWCMYTFGQFLQESDFNSILIYVNLLSALAALKSSYTALVEPNNEIFIRDKQAFATSRYANRVLIQKAQSQRNNNTAVNNVSVLFYPWRTLRRGGTIPAV